MRKSSGIRVRRFGTIVVSAYCALLMCAGQARIGYAEDAGRPQSGSDIDDLRLFLQLRSRLLSPVSAKERGKIQFSFGEYYFKSKAYQDAQDAFAKYIEQNPPGIGSLLANVYLHKIAVLRNAEEAKEAAKKEIFKEQFILLFDRYKTLQYTSLFNNKYEIRYFVDKIEIYLNGDLFEHIIP